MLLAARGVVQVQFALRLAALTRRPQRTALPHLVAGDAVVVGDGVAARLEAAVHLAVLAAVGEVGGEDAVVGREQHRRIGVAVEQGGDFGTHLVGAGVEYGANRGH